MDGLKTKHHRMKAPWLSLALGLALAGLAGFGQQARAVVGYVNVTVTNGYNFLANPLSLSGDNSPSANSITNVIPSAPDGSKVYLWDVTNQAFTAPSIYSVAATNWTINYFLPVGRGFVMQATSRWTITFVGYVLEGFLTNFVAGTNQFSLLGIMVPLSDSLSNLFFPGIDGDNAVVFYTPNQTYSDAFTYFMGYGWFDPNRAVSTDGPIIAVAQSFFIQNPAQSTNWIRHFTVPQAAAQSAARVVSSTDPEIQSLGLAAGTATLNVFNPGGASYGVQFSTDGVTWSTLATNQTGRVWKGIRPSSPQGYYRLLKR